MSQTEHFRTYLKDNGLAYTSGRRAILTGITALEGHFDTDILYDFLKKKGSRLSHATLYRALPLFVRSGIIRETGRAKGKACYEHAFGHEHHDHLECVLCGKIIEFMDNDIEMLQDKVCRKHGFTPVDHRLGIRGYCASCGEKA